MMTQEEWMDVKALRAAGWTIGQIAEHVGYHPQTVAGWLRRGGPPGKRSVPVADQTVDEHWRARIAGWLERNSALQPRRSCGCCERKASTVPIRR